MGGVWCRADRGHSTSYNSKGPFSTFSRWTDHVSQAYKKPKPRHRPPRPPQKPLRSNDRLTISSPQLVKEESSDGWRTATLIVPQTAPIPPPRKKKLRFQELARTAYSMDDLNSSPGDLGKSTFSLHERPSYESGLGSQESSSTLVVTPVLESRVNHAPVGELEVEEHKVTIEEGKGQSGDEKTRWQEESQQDRITNEGEATQMDKNTVQDEDVDDFDLGDEIIPVEKETMFTYRTLVHSNLGYVDKLSAISEVSAESGFDDRVDGGKFSERSESVASDESFSRDVGLNILDHIHNINNTTNDIDIREKTAISKKQWLENILKEVPDSYDIPAEKVKDRLKEEPILHHNNLNLATSEGVADGVKENGIPPLTNQSTTNHSVLLGILQANMTSSTQPYEGESIFLTNTKTNIIYKSLSSDKLTDDYDIEYPSSDSNNVLEYNAKSNEGVLKSTSNLIGTTEVSDAFIDGPKHNHESDGLFKTLNDAYHNSTSNNLSFLNSIPNSLPDNKKPTVMTTFQVEKINQNGLNKSDLQLTNSKTQPNSYSKISISVTSPESESESLDMSKSIERDDKLHVKESTKKGSASSSRRSSMTDSLHEFEISIYDMLKESNKYHDSSEEDESIKTLKPPSTQKVH